jgi:hypothetical protein
MRRETVLIFTALLTSEAQNAPNRRLRRDDEPTLTALTGCDLKDDIL